MNITEFRNGDLITQTITEKPFKTICGQTLQFVSIHGGDIVLMRQESINYTMIHLPFAKWQHGWEHK